MKNMCFYRWLIFPSLSYIKRGTVERDHRPMVPFVILLPFTYQGYRILILWRMHQFFEGIISRFLKSDMQMMNRPVEMNLSTSIGCLLGDRDH